MEGSTLESRTIRDMCLYRGGLALFTSNRPRYRPLAWKVPLWTPNRPRYIPSAWTVHTIDIEPSAILRLSMEGSALNPEPSAIHAPKRGRFRLGLRTVHDIGLQRGRFYLWRRTIRDIDLHRGRFALWYLNHPRYWSPAWKVPLWTPNLP